MVKRTITKHRVFFCGARTKLFFLIWKNFSSQKLTKTTLTVLQKFWRQPLTSWLSSCNFMKRAQRLLCSDPRWTAGRFKMCSVTFAPQMSESSVYSADSFTVTLQSDSWHFYEIAELQKNTKVVLDSSLCVKPLLESEVQHQPQHGKMPLRNVPVRKRPLKECLLVKQAIFWARLVSVATSFPTAFCLSNEKTLDIFPCYVWLQGQSDENECIKPNNKQKMIKAEDCSESLGHQ